MAAEKELQSSAAAPVDNNMDSLAHEGLAAQQAIVNERAMSLRDTLRLWPKAILFSFFLSLCIIMEGYDTNLMSNFYAYPAFKNHYGNQVDPDGGMLISATWQTAISNSTQAGSIIGLIINGIVTEWIGFKKSMIFFMVFLIGAVFIPFFSTGLPMFVAAGIVQGIPWGVFQTLAVTYAADICPVHLRTYMTSWINMCWVIGILLSSGILRGLMSIEGQWGYRIPFALQWIWPLPIIAVTFMAPESPWWLVRKGRLDEARAAVLQIVNLDAGIPFDIDAHMEMMQATNQLEIEISTGTHYWDCFRGSDLRRTEISSITWVVQALCGVPFMSYATQFLVQAGLGPQDAYSLNVGKDALQLFGCVCAWYIMTHVGRRTMYLYGLIFMFVILIVVGCIGIPAQNEARSWAIGSLLIVMLFFFQLSLGPACYSLVAEMPSTRLRTKTVALARAAYNIAGLATGFLMPQMIGRNAWDWGAKTAFFWAGITLLCGIWVFFRLPEPKGLTYAELDLLFEHRVSARKFGPEAASQFAVELTMAGEKTDGAGAHHAEQV
ncbi:alpha glucoside transporter [Emericellopsis atlantica]|uniref:Alpha glucoside transporter n=1 Tax=Emericellopsis atlantica TaxID=2614577 RepID=A0A9P7ZHH1_9HYPO|nr:alpha glucoside transporter [Emericellopsis atlantica]KAG9252199.1 alpha glucoside transporter [Emericellopsis atlantica]